MAGTSSNAGFGWVLGTGLACASLWSHAAGIYTCVDAKGRRLTSDRPIVECLDREQKELNHSGTVRRTVAPNLTAAEQALKDEQDRKRAEEAQRQAEEKRRERALLARYPDQAAHDGERAKALNAVEEVILVGKKRTSELQEQREQLAVEAAFFKDPSKVPPKLRRQLTETEQHLAAQLRFQANQEEEKRRVNRRFDEELARLRQLWAQLQAGSAAAPTATPIVSGRPPPAAAASAPRPANRY